jgi:Methyltransferase domain
LPVRVCSHFARRRLILAGAALLYAAAPARAQPPAGLGGTTADRIERMLRLAGLAESDELVELGCEDGWVSIIAAQHYGVHATGIDASTERIALARANAERSGAAARIEFIRADPFKVDLQPASVIVLSPLAEIIPRLRPQLLELAAGTRIVAPEALLGDWSPDESTASGASRAFLWRVPAVVSGTWTVHIDRDYGQETLQLNFRQQFQKLEGYAMRSGRLTPLSGLLTGAQIRFSVSPSGDSERVFVGQVRDGVISGEVSGPAGGHRTFSAAR